TIAEVSQPGIIRDGPQQAPVSYPSRRLRRNEFLRWAALGRASFGRKKLSVHDVAYRRTTLQRYGVRRTRGAQRPQRRNSFRRAQATLASSSSEVSSMIPAASGPTRQAWVTS